MNAIRIRGSLTGFLLSSLSFLDFHPHLISHLCILPLLTLPPQSAQYETFSNFQEDNTLIFLSLMISLLPLCIWLTPLLMYCILLFANTETHYVGLSHPHDVAQSLKGGLIFTY